MNSILFNIPASLIVGLLVGKLGLACLQMPMSTGWMATAVILCMILLLHRSVYELSALILFSIMAEMSLRGIGSFQIPTDVLLAIIISVILLPASLHIMGLHNPLARSANV